MIDRNIPLPKKPKFELTAILRQLEVGDSFILPNHIKNTSLPQTAKQIGIAVLQKKQPDGSIRVWRIDYKESKI